MSKAQVIIPLEIPDVRVLKTEINQRGDLVITVESTRTETRCRKCGQPISKFHGHKTELALGYGTLYGDLAGALCPLADLTKPEVYRLARFLGQALILAFVFERPPSAELRPDQVDPFDYEQLAPEMEAVVQANEAHPALTRSEHKRRQFGIVLKVSERAFGTGRMLPVTKK